MAGFMFLPQTIGKKQGNTPQIADFGLAMTDLQISTVQNQNSMTTRHALRHNQFHYFL